ncbi:uncharacterized protein HKW66_Vig0144290 [Vigna angularis]|uniref:Uncharacterized protein n=1 Tax=Phaseolus angularis TaxID=3914 RepID=A0A8T0KGX7_PHAAN|nr:uncharacterized protein HKW66_Vig0144290 [Vigna angularis]
MLSGEVVVVHCVNQEPHLSQILGYKAMSRKEPNSSCFQVFFSVTYLLLHGSFYKSASLRIYVLVAAEESSPWKLQNLKLSSRKLSHVEDIDVVVITPLSRSTSTFDRSSTPSFGPQPLPLPRAIDFRLPSSKDAATEKPNAAVDKPNAAVDFTLPTGFQMRM